MKVYIVTEHQENIIRFVTTNMKLAEQIDKAFPHLSLKIEEFEVIE